MKKPKQQNIAVNIHERVSRQSNGLWAALEDRVYNRTGVTCTVHVSTERISIRARDYPDYLLAKAAIEDQRKDLPITREL